MRTLNSDEENGDVKTADNGALLSAPHRSALRAQVDGEGGLQLGLGGDHPHVDLACGR